MVVVVCGRLNKHKHKHKHMDEGDRRRRLRDKHQKIAAATAEKSTKGWMHGAERL